MCGSLYFLVSHMHLLKSCLLLSHSFFLITHRGSDPDTPVVCVADVELLAPRSIFFKFSHMSSVDMDSSCPSSDNSCLIAAAHLDTSLHAGQN